MFRLRTLGQLAIVDASGAPLRGAAGQRKPLALLALLAAHGTHGVTRDRLAAFLWPEMNEERSRQALRQALYALRRDLGAPDLFLDGTSLRLNGAVAGSDIAEFLQAAAERRWYDLVGLRAGPFLDGFYLTGADEFERWVEAQRAEIETEYHTALAELAGQAAAAGDHAGAARWWRRRIAADPLDARSVLGVMRALESAGAPAAALECAAVHAARLADEVGTGPDARVAALASEIRARLQATARPSSETIEAPPAEPPASAPVSAPGSTTPAHATPRRPRWRLAGVLAAGLLTLGLATGPSLWPGPHGAGLPLTAVAVTAFDDVSPASEADRIGAAFGREVARSLAQVAALHVVGPGATGAYRDSVNRLELFGKELRAGSAVEGAVYLVGDQVSLTARLREVPSGRELWSTRFKGGLADLPTAKTRIARAIAVRLQGPLTDAETRRLEVRPTASPQAYWHYLRASTLDMAIRAENEAGIVMLKQAIREDSTFALAYAVLARRLMFNGFLVAPTYVDSGLAMVRRAIELDPTVSLAHTAMGDLLVLQGKPVSARLSYLKAIEVAPFDLGGMAGISDADANTGRLDESLYWGMRGMATGPVSADLHSHAGFPICLLAADAATERWLHDGERRWPEHGRHQILLSRHELMTGKGAAAVERMRRQLRRDPGDVEISVALAQFGFLAGSADAESLVAERHRAAPETRPYGQGLESFRAMLALLRLQHGDSAAGQALADTALGKAVRAVEEGAEDPALMVEAAGLSALLGDTAAALGWLRRAHEVGWKDYRYARVDPLLASLRAHPEFRSLLGRMEAETAAMRERVVATIDSAVGIS